MRSRIRLRSTGPNGHFLVTLCVLLSLYIGCTTSESSPTDGAQARAPDVSSAEEDAGPQLPQEPTRPHNASLRFNHLQALGTHNSYHQETPGISHPEWEYTHLPLDEQLDELGVRQFELDLWFNAALEDFDVLHIPLIDATTTCQSFRDCIQDLKGWSDAHPRHHPIVVLIELKNGFEEHSVEERIGLVEAALREVWTRERLVIPDDVRGDARDLRSAIQEMGWPPIDSLRGRALFVLHEGGAYREYYTFGGQHTRARLMFPDCGGDSSLPYAAVHVVNDPLGRRSQIEALVDAGHLVRTRADAGGAEARANDLRRLQAALDSGAHFITTDYPAPREGLEYVVRIPGGTPSRCNPRVALEDCRSHDIEDLSGVAP